jgi:hypothetical protein
VADKRENSYWEVTLRTVHSLIDFLKVHALVRNKRVSHQLPWAFGRRQWGLNAIEEFPVLACEYVGPLAAWIIVRRTRSAMTRLPCEAKSPQTKGNSGCAGLFSGGSHHAKGRERQVGIGMGRFVTYSSHRKCANVKFIFAFATDTSKKW